MSLTLVFRIQAALFAFFGTMMLLAPGAMMASFNVEASNVAEEIMRGMSLMALAMAYLVGKCQIGLVITSSRSACFLLFYMLHGLLYHCFK